MDEYSRWSRLTIRAHLESQKPDSCLEFANNMLILCKSNVLLVHLGFPGTSGYPVGGCQLVE